ncbi:Eco57I restriction-modification methylase domain-containing protein [Rubrobacter xylanophilus]|uniref:Eco57I restriction-modification methylase domain-containing protein n=1 Tax=Rubrobacter xylanophilus TaxID=49319 RepID=UPI00117B9EB3|nr:hypothetical protein [Rubrobacter xylanophilus]
MEKKDIRPAYRWTGPGKDGLEVVYGTANSKPNTTTIREIWKKRHGHRAAPLLVMVSYSDRGQRRAVVCGPAGDDPPVVYMDYERAERLADAALSEPDRHLALRFLAETLEGEPDEHLGLRNKGLLATHELLHGVPQRPDWKDATDRSKPLLNRRGQDLVRELGYEIEQKAQHSVLRSSGGKAQAVAVFLQESEQPDQPAARFENQTPVTYALAHADRDNIPWVVAERSGVLRLYSTSTSGAPGQRGRAETFVELNLPLLPSDQAGYLDLLFSSRALAEDGTISQIQQASSIYTSELSERLRERVYKQVVPRLAVAVADRVGGTGEEDLERHYRTALTILFRLMFVAYAEDSRLLPLNVNSEYTRHALKTIARDLSNTINEGCDLGFDNPLTEEIECGADTQTDLWDSCKALFHAVNEGDVRWGVPPYNGRLFSTDPDVNPVGRIIEELSLTNAEFGPALTALIVDRSPDDVIGPIDFRSLSVREFGTIYEGLLESELSVADQPLTVDSDGVYLPARDGDSVVVQKGEVYLHNQSGVRKSTGSYFTKPFAVDHLISHSVDPTLEEHLKRVKALLDEGKEADAAEMLFDFRVADIAMGSGHFLTAVVDRLEARYTTFLADHPIPHVTRELDALRKAANDALGQLADTVEIENSSLLRRLIARRCVYGVDLNPLAVELARVGMWIHTFVPGLPLSFLDHNLAVGNSLTGIGTIEEATAELVHGVGEGSLFAEPVREELRKAEEPLRRLAKISDATTSDIAEARETAAEVERAVASVAGLFDRIVAARIGEATLPDGFSPEDLFKMNTDHAREVAERMDALHFPVAFPEVFLRDRPGFDVILGNPPWEEATVEKLGFWALRFPGLKSFSQPQQRRKIQRLERERPDIAAEYERAVADAERLRRLLLSGPYPGMGTGDPDLYKAFSWRFWNLVRQDGAVGVVLPRSALSASGSEPWRQAVLDGGTFDDVTFLLNNKHWVFPDVHPQYTVGLVSIRKGEDHAGTLRLRGPYPSHERYDAGIGEDPAEFSTESFRTWTATASFPLLPSPEAAEVFAKLRAHPRLDDENRDWRARPIRELDATKDKKHMIFQDEPPANAWPVYKGSSFDLWNPDTGEYYAWADPDCITKVLQIKRRNQQRNPRSAFSLFPLEWVNDPSTLPCLHPRIAFRDITNRTNQRTVVTALIPGELVLTNTAPYLAWPRGDSSDEAYLLGVLASIPLDWYARRFVETHVNFYILNAFPIPRPDRDDPLRNEVVKISGRDLWSARRR